MNPILTRALQGASSFCLLAAPLRGAGEAVLVNRTGAPIRISRVPSPLAGLPKATGMVAWIPPGHAAPTELHATSFPGPDDRLEVPPGGVAVVGFREPPADGAVAHLRIAVEAAGRNTYLVHRSGEGPGVLEPYPEAKAFPWLVPVQVEGRVQYLLRGVFTEREGPAEVPAVVLPEVVQFHNRSGWTLDLVPVDASGEPAGDGWRVPPDATLALQHLDPRPSHRGGLIRVEHAGGRRPAFLTFRIGPKGRAVLEPTGPMDAWLLRAKGGDGRLEAGPGAFPEDDGERVPTFQDAESKECAP